MHGPQRDIFDLTFAVPSACAAAVRDHQADIGIVPVATLLEQDLEIFRGAGIAVHGAVRTILLISKVPFRDIGVLAVDASSRTSVLLSRIFLSQVHGNQPVLVSLPPDLDSMLSAADAALIIGDPALLLEPDTLRAGGLLVADLGAEWTRMTGLPMVFAVWAGHKRVHTPENEVAFIASCRFGLDHIEDIVQSEHARRGVTVELARHYLTCNLVLQLDETDYRGMALFLKSAAALAPEPQNPRATPPLLEPLTL